MSCRKAGCAASVDTRGHCHCLAAYLLRNSVFLRFDRASGEYVLRKIQISNKIVEIKKKTRLSTTRLAIIEKN